VLLFNLLLIAIVDVIIFEPQCSRNPNLYTPGIIVIPILTLFFCFLLLIYKNKRKQGSVAARVYPFLQIWTFSWKNQTTFIKTKQVLSFLWRNFNQHVGAAFCLWFAAAAVLSNIPELVFFCSSLGCTEPPGLKNFSETACGETTNCSRRGSFIDLCMMLVLMVCLSFLAPSLLIEMSRRVQKEKEEEQRSGVKIFFCL